MSFQTVIKTKFSHKIDLPKIEVRGKKLQADLIAKRTTITLWISDYISEHIGLGRTVSESEAALFTKETTAPDAAIEINFFRELTGIDPRTNKKNPEAAFFESKVRGLGNQTGITLTSTTIAKDTKPFNTTKEFADSNNKTTITGAEAVDLIFTKQFDDVRQTLFETAYNKIENLLFIDTLDADKKPRLTLNFVKSPITKDSLTGKKNILKYYRLEIRPRYNTKKEITAYRVTISPSPSLYADMNKRAKDITNKVMSLHEKGIADNLFSYLVSRIEAETRSNKDINEYLALCIAIANEFKEGGHTPFIINSEVKTPTVSKQSIEVALKNKKATQIKKQQAIKAQKFISSIQWTALVQAKLGKTMRKTGKATPPFFTERSGTWRSSVEISANYRSKLVSYKYNPIYRVNMQYGYNPDLQIKKAISSVAKELYGYEFGITAKI